MEPWPTVAHILLMMSSIADWLRMVQMRDFTIKDIIHLHPSSCWGGTSDFETNCLPSFYRIMLPLACTGPCVPSSTPHPRGFKCFTCQDAADNYECNRWAPDVYCPKDTRYCYAVHMMDHLGDSVSVSKRCVTAEDCLFTGCAEVTDIGYRVCSSCCEGNICNLLVPRNESAEVFSSASPLVSSGKEHHAATLIDVFSISILTLGSL